MPFRFRVAGIVALVFVFCLAGSAWAEFFKPQQRKGLAIGPRIGVYMPQDEDLQKHVPIMFQIGLDVKAYVPKVPWVGFAFGVGFMGGGSTDEDEFTYEKEVNGETVRRTRQVDTYWATMIIPVTGGLVIEFLPKSVFDPYLGGGVGYYYITNVEPIVDDLPAEYEETRAPATFNRAGTTGYYLQLGLDTKFHDYLGVKLEGLYHSVKGGNDLDDADLSGIMISLGSFVYF